MAIYQGDTKISGAGVSVDRELSDSSTNPVQNQAVTKALEDVGYDTWQKPDDWVDVRSGAFNNSIYLLVAHKADYSQYAKFSFSVTTSTSANTYDVYVDSLKYATVDSGTATTLDWQTLALDSGYDVTYPSNLRTHVVRITPTQNTDTLTRFYCQGITGQQEQGLLWAHFELSNPIRVYAAFGNEGTVRNYLLEAVTAKNDNLTYIVHTSSGGSGLYEIFAYCSSLKKIPVLTANSTEYTSGTYLSFADVPLKKVVIKGNSGTENLSFLRSTKVQEFDIENGVVLGSGTGSLVQATNASNLKKLPTINASNQETFLSSGLTSLQDTVIDDSSNSSRKLLRFYGSNTAPVRGLKGLTVSNEAPFDGASPQLNVAYTGLDRQALRQLFKSMPYNVGYEVVGSPTIVDGVASGFSSSDYLGFSSDLNVMASANSWEVVIKFIHKTVSTFSAFLGNTGSYFSSFGVNAANKLRLGLFDGSTTVADILSTTVLQDSQSYYAKFIYDSTEGYKMYLSTDGTAYTLENSSSNTAKFKSQGTWKMGFVYSNPFPGSIDLNETYININGIPFFTGKAAMTKTCSIVGCTGTADLTAEDKNIALDKGWELTVE